jgi:hypothetical protein
MDILPGEFIRRADASFQLLPEGADRVVQGFSIAIPARLG